MDILIAEDSATSRSILKKWAGVWGYETHLAADGNEAWSWFQKRQTPCLAIIDWMMPGMDGIELCQRLKQQAERPYVYIILLTGKHDKQDIVTGLDAGADDFLSKPVRADELRSRLQVGARILGYQEALSERNEQLRALFAAMPGLLLVKDAQGHWLEANERTRQVFGLRQPEQYLHKTDQEIAVTLDSSKAQLLQRVQNTEERSWLSAQLFREELTVPPQNHYNSEQCFDLIRVPLFHADGRRRGMMLLGHDITARKSLERKLRYAAYYDSLTGLCNRRYFQEQLDKALDVASKDELPLSLCVCDIDTFKIVNDSYGHDIGDTVLVRFAKVVRQSIRTQDIASRFGGDEFCIVFPGLNATEAANILNCIRHRLHQEVFYDDAENEFRVTGSFGVANFIPHRMQAKQLIKQADMALYQAKHSGRNRVIIEQTRS